MRLNGFTSPTADHQLQLYVLGDHFIGVTCVVLVARVSPRLAIAMSLGVNLTWLQAALVPLQNQYGTRIKLHLTTAMDDVIGN